jgi:phasin family protein
MAKSPFPFDMPDFTKIMGETKIPGVDWQELIAAQQKNMEALSKANQVMVEGAQAVVQRQVEVMQKAMAELTEASQALIGEADPKTQAEKRVALAKASFETALGNMRELAELAGRSNSEALEVINRRAVEGFDEIKQAIDKAR